MLDSASDSTTPLTEVTAQELAETIAEFEHYRQRLVDETMTTAQRAKLSKTKVMAQLQPELDKIDAALQQLRQQQLASHSHSS